MSRWSPTGGLRQIDTSITHGSNVYRWVKRQIDTSSTHGSNVCVYIYIYICYNIYHVHLYHDLRYRIIIYQILYNVKSVPIQDELALLFFCSFSFSLFFCAVCQCRLCCLNMTLINIYIINMTLSPHSCGEMFPLQVSALPASYW